MGEIAVRKSESFWDQIQQMEERILRRAHDIFLNNGSEVGKDLQNWLAAEKELVWKPAIQLKEKSDSFELEVDVAGVEPKDLKIEATPDDILIKGSTERTEKKQEGEVRVSEFQSGTLFRSVHFPKQVDPGKVKAGLKNGLLTITAPIAEQAKARRVNIQVA